jgi:hypothetical protein
MLQVQEIFSDEAFFRLENHGVMTEDGKVIQSWMWTEVPDMVSPIVTLLALFWRGITFIVSCLCIYPQINVLIRDVKGDYILLQQSKYGIEGESYAGNLQDETER